MTIAGIDISSNNGHYSTINTTGLSFAIVKLTQGANYINPLAGEELAWARTWARWVGGYHWTEPWVPAAAQAANFLDVAGRDGPLDFWGLDNEDPTYPPDKVPWLTVVPSIFDIIAANLGPERGCCYQGRYFYPPLNTFAAAHNWWLSDYRAHPDTSGGVVIHQWSSAGGLDHNVVLDEPAFYRMVGTQQPIPTPSPSMVEAEMFLVQEKGSQTIHAIGAGPNGVTDLEAAHLNAWKAALVGTSGRNEAATIWPVEQGFCDNIRKGS